MYNKSRKDKMTKRVMWWNLPIEEVEELARENKLNTMTCVEYDDTNKEESEEENNEQNKTKSRVS